MAKFPSSIFRQQSSSPPSSSEVEAEGIADGEKQSGVCAQINPLISLPDDVLFKILLNLSAEDIYRASLVCRRLYYHTIKSEEFVNLHLRQTDEYGLLFQFTYAPTRELIHNDQHSSQRKVFVSMKQGRVTVSDYYCAYISRFNSRSCNGLIPEYSTWVASSGVLVVNPVTGRAFQLPPLPENVKFMHCGVGYAQASKAYKVALAYRAGGMNPPHAQWAILTVGVDSSWRHLATDHLTESTLGHLVVTEGFVHSISEEIVLTLNVETEVMMETRAPIIFSKNSPKFTRRWPLSTGKSLTLVVEVRHHVYRVWEMVSGNYWKEWERQIVLGSRIMREIQEVCGDKDFVCMYPVGWLQQMEVLVFAAKSKCRAGEVFYVVIATGEVGWITPISSNKEGLVEEFYKINDPVVTHTKTPLCSWRGTIKPIYPFTV